MKTTKIVFVIDDNDESFMDKEIHEWLEGPANVFPLFAWMSRESTKKEIVWRKRYDKRR